MAIGRACREGWRPVALLLALVLSACNSERIERVAPDASASRPVFHLVHPDGSPITRFYGLSVVSCSGDAVLWTLQSGGTNAAPPLAIAYGETPTGYTSATGPRPLDPGCYKVLMPEGLTARFRIDAKTHRVVPADSSGVVTAGDTTHASRPATP
jgi:hypothetical protein